MEDETLHTTDDSFSFHPTNTRNDLITHRHTDYDNIIIMVSRYQGHMALVHMEEKKPNTEWERVEESENDESQIKWL